MAVALALLDAGGVTSSRRARSGKLGTPNRQERGARSARMGILAGVGDQGNTFDISIGALSGVVQHDNGPSKRHNATQQRDNGKTPERGAEKATTPTKSDVAVTRQFIRTEICCYKVQWECWCESPRRPEERRQRTTLWEEERNVKADRDDPQFQSPQQ
ncbi:hypothetical protein C8R43DRAFT_966223 [Mycena crocata]|nr:hypothetical protein C8R43DRAFT_966223 [Mycena crocata]